MADLVCSVWRAHATFYGRSVNSDNRTIRTTSASRIPMVLQYGSVASYQVGGLEINKLNISSVCEQYCQYGIFSTNLIFSSESFRPSPIILPQYFRKLQHTVAIQHYRHTFQLSHNKRTSKFVLSKWTIACFLFFLLQIPAHSTAFDFYGTSMQEKSTLSTSDRCLFVYRADWAERNQWDKAEQRRRGDSVSQNTEQCKSKLFAFKNKWLFLDAHVCISVFLNSMKFKLSNQNCM